VRFQRPRALGSSKHPPVVAEISCCFALRRRVCNQQPRRRRHWYQIVDLGVRTRSTVTRVIEEADRALALRSHFPDEALDRDIHGSLVGIPTKPWSVAFLSLCGIRSREGCKAGQDNGIEPSAALAEMVQ